jgi:hypothetical protein
MTRASFVLEINNCFKTAVASLCRDCKKNTDGLATLNGKSRPFQYLAS